MESMKLLVVRWIALAALAVGGTGCPRGDLDAGASYDEGQGPDSEGGGGGGASLQCDLAESCEAAASTCCECPTFAVPVGSGFDQGCSEVECGPMGDCPLVEPACVSGVCELVCAIVEVTRSCDSGFAVDTFGCLVDECSSAPPAGTTACELDDECVQVAGDCCGCERGGSDTAVHADDAAAHRESLECLDNARCPEVDVCSPSVEPRCVSGLCRLVSSGSDPDDGEAPTCGASADPPCAAGTACVLNHPDGLHATEAGLASCQP